MKFSYYLPNKLNKMSSPDKLYHSLTYFVYTLLSLAFVVVLLVFLSSVEVDT